MKLHRRIAIILSLISLGVVVGCKNNRPLLTDLDTNRLIVIIKGTYESNSPRSWIKPDPNLSGAGVQDDSVIYVTPGTDVFPTTFMLDISDMKLLDSNVNTHQFANIRQTIAMNLNDADPFFNGQGVMLHNDDVSSKIYLHLYVYVRKMLFDNARKYDVSSTTPGWNPVPYFDTFNETPVIGFNFNQFQSHSSYDIVRLEGYLFNRVFPVTMVINESMMAFNQDNPATVLEIRFVVKNFIKKFELETTSNGIWGYLHYYGLSDWLQNVQVDEATLGGNLLAVARSYVPGTTGSISGTNSTGHGAHVIAIPQGADINGYTLSSNNARGSNPCNMPRAPTFYTGADIDGELNYLLALEKYKYNWNQKFPTPPTNPDCASFDGSTAGGTGVTTPAFTAKWDEFAADVDPLSGIKVPPLAVWVGDAPPNNTYTIDNVPPGSYDVYISDMVPAYGQFYTNGHFVSRTTVTVGVGQAVTGVNF